MFAPTRLGLALLGASLTIAAEPRLDRYGDPLPPGAIARLGTVRFSHNHYVWALTYSPDGKTIASASRDGRLALWDAVTGEERLCVDGDFLQISFLGDSDRLAAFRTDGTVMILDAGTGEVLRSFASARDGAWCCYSAMRDGRLFAVGAGGGIELFDTATGRETVRLPRERTLPGALAFSSDGKRLVSTDTVRRNTVIWDMAARCEIGRMEARGLGMLRFVWSPDGRTLLATDYELTLSAWDAETCEEQYRIDATAASWLGVSEANAMAFSPDGSLFAAAITSSIPSDSRVCLRRVDSGQEFLRLNHLAAATAVAFSPDGKTLAVGGLGSIRRFDVASGKEIAPRDAHCSGGMLVHWSPDGRTVVTHGGDRTWRTWDAATGRPLYCSLPLHTGFPRGDLSPDGKTLALRTIAREDPVCLFDVASGRELRHLGGDRLYLETLAFAPDSKTLAGGFPANITIWDVKTGRRTRTIAVESSVGAPGFTVGLIDGLTFSPDGRSLCGMVFEGEFLPMPRLGVWDVMTGTELPVLEPRLTIGQDRLESGPTMWPVFAPDGRSIAAFVVDDGKMRIRLWEAATGCVRHTFARDVPDAHSLAFSPDGRFLAITAGNEIRPWDATTGQELRRLRGHRGTVNRAAFSPDGRRLVSSGEDPSALIWDVADLMNPKK